VILSFHRFGVLFTSFRRYLVSEFEILEKSAFIDWLLRMFWNQAKIILARLWASIELLSSCENLHRAYPSVDIECSDPFWDSIYLSTGTRASEIEGLHGNSQSAR
jgi:hypothetical protein